MAAEKVLALRTSVMLMTSPTRFWETARTWLGIHSERAWRSRLRP